MAARKKGVSTAAVSKQISVLEQELDITLSQFANDNQLGGLSMWSLSRDKPCPDQWASPICSGANLQKEPYD